MVRSGNPVLHDRPRERQNGPLLSESADLGARAQYSQSPQCERRSPRSTRVGSFESLERFDARGRTSNAYLIAWAPLFAAYSAYVTRRRNPKVDATPRPKPDATPRPKVDATPRPKVDAKSMNVEPINGGTKEVEPMALSGACTPCNAHHEGKQKRASRERGGGALLR